MCVETIPWRLGGVSDLAESSRNYCKTAQKLFSIVLSVDMCVSREAGLYRGAVATSNAWRTAFHQAFYSEQAHIRT